MLKGFFLFSLGVLLLTSMSYAGWETPQNLGSTVNSSWDDRRAAISFDGNTLYFSSDRPGGHGDFDIWRSTNAGGVWQAPVNLGPPVNTAYMDFLPSISPDGNTLYFVSDRGGNLDVWVSTNSGGSWQTPTNLVTINSSATE